MNGPIELTNVSFGNKGDHLMVEAVLGTLSARMGQTEFCVPWGQATAGIRRRHHFRQVPRLAPGQNARRKALKRLEAVSLRSIIAVCPSRVVYRMGLVPERRVHAVLDISGFAFSDFWGSAKAEAFAERYRECKKRGTKVILMPKTFGPFSDQRIADCTRSIIASADLVFCRDRVSYEYLEGIGALAPHVHIAPDYTGTVNGSVPSYGECYRKRAAIIPNCRMLDKTGERIAKAYLPFLAYAYKYLEARGERPFVLLHQPYGDRPVVDGLERLLGRQIDVLVDDDPLAVKGVIGQCSSVVSSRLHGIINGLSQGIPAVGTGWAHKYTMLFEDYDCPELLIRDLCDLDEVKTKLDMLCDEPQRRIIETRLRQAQRKLIEANTAMWDQVVCTLATDRIHQ